MTVPCLGAISVPGKSSQFERPSRSTRGTTAEVRVAGNYDSGVTAPPPPLHSLACTDITFLHDHDYDSRWSFSGLAEGVSSL